MPVEDLLSALDTIENPAGNFIVVMTGGEPLLRNDIEKCGLEIRKRGMRWSLVTNGHLYDKERQNSLLNTGMGALTISLDGIEESHNWLRRSPGSFEKVGNAISLAASSSRLNFDVVTCVNKRNIVELSEILDFLISKGVQTWRLFTIVPIGRASNNTDLLLTPSQFKRLMDFIASSRNGGKFDLKFSCEGYVGKYEYKVRDGFFFCRAGINIGSILIDGSISACPNIDRSFVQGNIYKDNFYRTWQTKFEPFRNRNWTRTGECAECHKYPDCLGNGFHNWHGDKKNTLVCHNKLIEKAFSDSG
jgi:radical SAM enzyme (rSAM/lipoprotein system)